MTINWLEEVRRREVWWDPLHLPCLWAQYVVGMSNITSFLALNVTCTSNMLPILSCNVIQDEHKVLPWLQTNVYLDMLELYVAPQLEEFQLWIIFQQDGAPPYWGSCLSVFGCIISKLVDWVRWSDTLATMIARYNPPPSSFYGGMLRTKCFWHQFQILQILRQE